MSTPADNPALRPLAGLRALELGTGVSLAFAARLLRQGRTLKEVQEAGGWSPASMPMVAETYAHLEKSAVDAAVREADGPLARLLVVEEGKKANG